MLPALGSAVVGGVAPTYGGSGASEAWLQATIAYSFPMEKKTHSRPIALVIHGGAGVIERDQLGADDERAIHADLDVALDAGHAVPAGGGSALDAGSEERRGGRGDGRTCRLRKSAYHSKKKKKEK